MTVGLSLFQTFLSILTGVIVALTSGYIAKHRENQRWLREEIYRPLYNEVERASDGAVPDSSIWSEFDQYQKYRTDSELKKRLDRYEENLRQLKELEREPTVDETFINRMPDGMAEMDNGTPILIHRQVEENENVTHRSLIEARKWLEMFGPVVIQAEDPEEMREQLIMLSKEEGWGHEENFRRWDEEHPNWPGALWWAVHEETVLWEKIEKIDQLRNDEIPDTASKIQEELQTRINENFLKSIWREMNLRE